MLELRDLVVRYGSGRKALDAVDGVSLTIPKGATVGLVGESGSGKSTLGRSIVRLAPIRRGTILFDGQDVTSERARRAPAYTSRVQMVFQDPRASLNPRMTVGEAIGEALRRRGGGRAQRQADALRALELVGLGRSALERYPHQFSGGQRQRIAIARALATRPDVIILDEVTSALDVSVQATILNVLRDVQRELGVSYLFISHDLSVIGVMSDIVAVMYLGQIVERAEAASLFSEARHPYTRMLLESVLHLDAPRGAAPLRGDVADPRNPPAGCRFHPRCPIGPRTHPDRTVCTELDPQSLAAEDAHRTACHFAQARDAALAPSGDDPRSAP